MINVLYTLLATEQDGLVNRTEVRRVLDEQLRNLPERITGPSRETWGTSPDAVARLRAAEQMAGGQPDMEKVKAAYEAQRARQAEGQDES